MVNKRATKQEVILDAWRSLLKTSVGEAELKTIQSRLEEVLGAGGFESPASIARTLADADAPLRLPEVLEFDARWRESRVYALFGPGELVFDDLDNSLESVAKIRDLGDCLSSEGDEVGMKGLADYVKKLKSELERASAAGSVGREVAEWLRVWLQNPAIFNDWLGLRLNSPDFREKFGS